MRSGGVVRGDVASFRRHTSWLSGLDFSGSKKLRTVTRKV